MIIKGFRVKTTDISNLEMEIQKIKHSLDKKSNNLYQKLLGEQAAFLYDQLALNILTHPQCSFLDWVLNELNLKIKIESQHQVASKYNFNVYAHVMNYGEYTYLKIICENPTLLKAFDSLEEYSLTETEAKDKRNKKTQIWNDLCKMYEKKAVLSLNLSPELLPDKNKITFPSKKDRCQKQARHDLTSHYLKMVAGDGQIPPYLIMSCMDEAFDLLLTEDAKIQMDERYLKLMQILPDSEEIQKKLFPEDYVEVKENEHD